jgi:membrane-associated protease RseP (regulator of RpoE activity)
MNSWTVQVGRQWRVVSGIIGVILVSLGLGAIVLGLRSPAAAASLQSLKDAGILVTSVTDDSAAAQAGLKRGDIILGIDDRTTDEVATLQEYVLSKQSGDQVRLNVQHGDDLRTLTVTLGERQGRPYMGVVPFVEHPWPASEVVSATAGLPPFMEFHHIGGATGPLSDVLEFMPPGHWPMGEAFTGSLSLRAELAMPGQPLSDTLFFHGPGLPFTHTFELDAPLLHEFMIISVEPGSPAAQAGLVAGDSITAIDGADLEAPFALIAAVAAAAPGDSLALTVRNAGGEERSVNVTLGEDPRRAGEAYLGINGGAGGGGFALPAMRPGMPLFGIGGGPGEDFMLPVPALACPAGAPCGRLEI